MDPIASLVCFRRVSAGLGNEAKSETLDHHGGFGLGMRGKEGLKSVVCLHFDDEGPGPRIQGPERAWKVGIRYQSTPLPAHQRESGEVEQK